MSADTSEVVIAACCSVFKLETCNVVKAATCAFVKEAKVLGVSATNWEDVIRATDPVDKVGIWLLVSEAICPDVIANN